MQSAQSKNIFTMIKELLNGVNKSEGKIVAVEFRKIGVMYLQRAEVEKLNRQHLISLKVFDLYAKMGSH